MTGMVILYRLIYVRRRNKIKHYVHRLVHTIRVVLIPATPPHPHTHTHRYNRASRWTILGITAHSLCNSYCNILDENSITADRSAEQGKRHNVHCPSIHCHNTDPTHLRATLTQVTSHKTKLPYHIQYLE